MIGLILPAAGNGRIGGLTQPNLLGTGSPSAFSDGGPLPTRAQPVMAIRYRLISGHNGIRHRADHFCGTYLGLLAGTLFWLRRRPKLMFLLAAIGSLTPEPRPYRRRPC